MGKQVAARFIKKRTSRLADEYSTVCKGLQLSWLERTPDKREVDGSSPFNPTKLNKTVERYKQLTTEMVNGMIS